MEGIGTSKKTIIIQNGYVKKRKKVILTAFHWLTQSDVECRLFVHARGDHRVMEAVCHMPDRRVVSGKDQLDADMVKLGIQRVVDHLGASSVSDLHPELVGQHLE